MSDTEPAPADTAGMQARLIELEAYNKKLESALGLSTTMQATFKLSARQNKLLGLLMETNLVTQAMLEEHLGITKNAKMAVHRLRVHLRGHGHNLEIKARRNVGWYLEENAKAALREKLTPRVAVDALSA